MARLGYGIDKNPYPKDSSAFGEWDGGWWAEINPPRTDRTAKGGFKFTYSV